MREFLELIWTGFSLEEQDERFIEIIQRAFFTSNPWLYEKHIRKCNFIRIEQWKSILSLFVPLI